jgi:hypothetical protein
LSVFKDPGFCTDSKRFCNMQLSQGGSSQGKKS